ncbi:hypothetical protein SAMN06265368_3167 [Cohaesibacter gelatinilyticus]|uniref:Uncharacterized protein n=1 Tax=Cohaesibacter gelatinilyticus TaxID=372072 RepID=A0A285PF49_9HYPH|nr:hypothetical protein SAMN06265368_3167 [Cohaesibacter gelatinilyticus]
MHHKRKRPINRRAGCKLCKPWKINGVRRDSFEGETHSDRRRRLAWPLTRREFAQAKSRFY